MNTPCPPPHLSSRRYSLLFAVNGGAFAVARILVGAECKPPLRKALPECWCASFAGGRVSFSRISLCVNNYSVIKGILRELTKLSPCKESQLQEVDSSWKFIPSQAPVRL